MHLEAGSLPSVSVNYSNSHQKSRCYWWKQKKEANATKQSISCWLLQTQPLTDFFFTGIKSTAVNSTNDSGLHPLYPLHTPVKSG